MKKIIKKINGWIVKGEYDIVFFEKKPIKQGGKEWFSKTGGYIDLTSQLEKEYISNSPVKCKIVIETEKQDNEE